MARQEITIGAPGTLNAGVGFWALEAQGLRLSGVFLADGMPAELSSLVIQDESLRLTIRRGQDSGTLAGPELTDAWKNHPEALTLAAGGQSWTFPGPGGTDETEPYFWTHIGVAAALAAYNALDGTERAGTRLIFDDGLPTVPDTPGAGRITPLMHLRELLAANDDLPEVHAHTYRGAPGGAALVLTGLGGEGITGVSFTPARNIDFVRLESRHKTFRTAEENLDRAVNVMRASDRLVSVESTITDYEPSTEVYRLWCTAEVRR